MHKPGKDRNPASSESARLLFYDTTGILIGLHHR